MSNQRCVKFLLGFVLFLVVSLCSFTLSFADSTGTYTCNNTSSPGRFSFDLYGQLPMSGDFSLQAGDFITITPNNYEFGDTLYIVASNSSFRIDDICENSSTGVITSHSGVGYTSLGHNLYGVRLASGTSSNFNRPIQIKIRYGSAATGISSVFIDSADKSVADLLSEVESFHSDVNDKLQEIYNNLAMNKYITTGSILGLSDGTLDVYPVSQSTIDDIITYIVLHCVGTTVYSPTGEECTLSTAYRYDRTVNGVSYSFVMISYVRPNGRYASALYTVDEGDYVLGAVNSIDSTIGLNNSTDHFNNQAQQNEALEHEFTGSMSANFEALNLDSFDFNADTLSGMAVVGGIMTSLFNSMGKWGIVYTFPLLLGVVLVVIGRVARSDRKERSGDGSKLSFQEWKDHNFG